MSSVFQKLFAYKDGKKTSKLGIFCRRPRPPQTPVVIELPSKDVKTREEASVFVAMPPPDVRLVLFQECGETSDRRLLFDSKSFEPLREENTEYTVTASNVQQGPINNITKPRSKSYQYVRGPQDMDILSEMLFGTVGMASRASSLKIHIIKERLMLSRVFCVESAKEPVSLDRGMDYQRLPIPVLSRRKAKTLPVPTPEPPSLPPPVPQSLASSLTSRITRSDSSSSLISLSQILGTSLGATGSLGSRSSPQQIPSNRAHSLPPATRQASRDSFTLTQEPHHSLTSRRTKVKIGFAVMFQPEPSNSCEFQRFFFEHFPLIEGYVTFLKEQVENALNNYRSRAKMDFNEAMMEALHVFTLRIHAVYSTPRLAKPVWSSLVTATSQSSPPWKGHDITIKCFISELARMVNQHNTRQKNFFMSGLITSVLTHHLGWVNTTLPPNNSELNSQTVAYNPLWAQLGDLYGAVGTPTKVAKTVVIGEIHELMSTIISILSYFIRCSNIDEVVEVPADMTPQAFSNDHASLSMSYVSSDLESSKYVLVTVEDGYIVKAVERDSENELSKAKQPITKEKPKVFSFCRRSKNSEPISMKKQEKDSLETSNGSTLCRSRSSPGTSVKPQIKVINRQKSSGNFENLPSMRLRTNSNDTFARPRGVQSRRTSREASQQRMSQSSNALVIPNSEKSDNTVSSLEGSKSLCLAPTPNSDKLKKRLGNENMGSCPKDFAGNVKTSSTVTASTATSGHQSANASILTQRPRLRTHKRVSSEPFNVTNLKSEPPTSTSLVKTKSTYFSIVRQTFVEHIEPKIINVAHVQRSQHVIAMPSPLSSPCLPRSKSSSGQKGPIMGFETNDVIDPLRTPRFRHSSGNALQDRQTDKSPKTNGDRDVFSPKKPDLQIASSDLEHSESKFVFNNAGVRRSSSNMSTSSTIRRSSSGKVKLAGRRRKLTDSSKTSSIDEGEETVPDLPPLGRIPSISLEHDEFDKYFKEDAVKDVYISFSTDHHSTVTDSHSSTINSVKHEAADQSSKTKAKRPAPIPSTPPCGTSKTQQCIKKSQSTVAESVNQKAENVSCATKKPPPPLPSIGPCHRSHSTKSEHGEKMVTSPIRPTPKSAPPLPAAPPVHCGSLYPKLDKIMTPNATKPLPKTSIYPNLNETLKKTPQSTGVYPKLDESPLHNPFAGRMLYPRLSDSSQDTHVNPPCAESAISEEKESVSGEDKDSESGEYFAIHEEVVLRAVELSDKLGTKRTDADDGKPTKLTFGELLADYSPEYLWGFALHGTKNRPNFYMNVVRELQHSISHPVLDEPVAEAVSIVADTDKWSVKVLSSHRIHSDKIALPALNSKLVTVMLERVMKLYQMNVPAEFCLQQLESSLGELVLKSRMLAGYVTGNTRVTMPQLSAVLGIGPSDLPLLMAIASCHSPQVAAKLLW